MVACIMLSILTVPSDMRLNTDHVTKDLLNNIRMYTLHRSFIMVSIAMFYNPTLQRLQL